jgi:hypothetical protein
MANPYLPDIFEGIVTKVSQTFTSSLTDPFNVYFDKGIQSQVAKNIYKNNAPTFPLIWLVMNFIEDRGKDPELFGSVRVEIIIAMPTDNSYTQQQRDDIVFKPRLIPVYDELLTQIIAERWFRVTTPDLTHKRILRPYWGFGALNGVDSKNLFENFIDAIQITDLFLDIYDTKIVC